MVVLSTPIPEMAGRTFPHTFAAVEAWAETWYRDDRGRDRLSFDGIPCGDAIRVDVFEFVLEAVSAALGLPSRHLGRPAYRQLRAHGLDRDVRAWGLRVAAAGRTSPRARRPVAIISEVTTPSALGSSMEVGRVLTDAKVAVAVSDPRGYGAWRRSGWVPFALMVNPMDDRQVVRGAAARAAEAWREAQRACPPLIIGERDLTSLALESMDRFLPRSLARLAVDWKAIARFLDAVDASVLVLASDQHRVGRLAVEIARQGGRRSIVLQHGLPQARTGYLPVHADDILVWSEAAASWFVDGGTPADRVTVVGNPRLDELARVLAASNEGLGGGPATRQSRVLLALSVAPTAVNSRLVDITLDAVRSLPGTALIIKLHPGGSDWSFVRRAVQRGDGPADSVTILERDPLYPLLAWSDVVLAHRSSVAVEALAARRPVIAIAADGSSVARIELSDLDLPETDNARELARLIVAYTGDAAAEEFMNERQAGIVRAVGPVDGLAARRAAAAIDSATLVGGHDQAGSPC